MEIVLAAQILALSMTLVSPCARTAPGEVPFVCPGCTQVITDDAYWSGPEPANLCTNDGIAAILQGVHGPPTITPMPNSNPCSQTLMCDPARYNRIIEIYRSGDDFYCYRTGIDFINDADPSQCDVADSGIFLDPDGDPIKAFLCYFEPNIDAA